MTKEAESKEIDKELLAKRLQFVSLQNINGARVLDGAAEAMLSQIACTEAPDGRQRWTIQMLRDKLIEMEVVESVGWETVRTTLKKMNLSLG